MHDGRATVNDGISDLARASASSPSGCPTPLAPLARLAYNYRWSWLPGAPGAVSLDRPRALRALPREPGPPAAGGIAEALRRAAADPELRRARGARSRRGERRPRASGRRRRSIDPTRPVAFLCAEYGVHVSLPVYSGGLGALAGDLLKEASDQALPLVAVGLMYRKGYFRQRIDAGGWQHEYWIDTDPQRLPAALVTDAAASR